jgi:HK97 family phage portal protein
MAFWDGLFTRPKKKDKTPAPQTSSMPAHYGTNFGGSLSEMVNGGTVTKVTHPDEAIKMAEYYNCVHKLSNTVATLSRNWYRKTDADVSAKLSDADYDQVALWKNMMYPGLVPSKVIKTWVANYLKGGNGYLIQKRDPRTQRTTSYINRKWNEMYPFYDYEGNVWYYDYVTKKAYFWLDVLHLADITDDALIGKTKVSHQAETLGRSKAAQTFVNKYFGKGLFLGAWIGYPENADVDDETATTIEQKMAEMYGGVDKYNSVAIITAGGQLHQLKTDIPLSDSNYIENEIRTADQIKGFFSIPTKLESETDLNQYYNDAIMPIIRMIEEEVALKVPAMAEIGQVYMKFEVDSILRAAPETKINVLARAIDKGLMTINEGRSKMELPPIEGGDKTLVMANNLVPLSELEDFVKSKM